MDLEFSIFVRLTPFD